METSDNLLPTPSAGKTTSNTKNPHDLVNSKGEPWKLGEKPHDRRTGKPVTTTMADVLALLPTPQAGDGEWGLPRTSGRPPDKSTHLATRLFYSPAASPANPSPKLDEEKERTMTATSGRRCYESYESFLPYGSSLKTCVASLLKAEVWFSSVSALTWKHSATKYNRLLFQLSPSTRPTVETESGLLATPNTMDAMAPKTDKAVLREATVTRKGRTKFANLRDQIYRGMRLKTPSASEGIGGWKVADKYWEADSPKLKMRYQIGRATGLKLQPAFALWMMGYPLDWLDLEDGEMPRSKGRGTR